MLGTIDAGHGAGGDPGAVGQSGLQESFVTAEVGWKLTQKLQQLGYQIYFYGPGIRENLYMGDRAYSALTMGSAFHISLHCNAANDENAVGMEVWYNDSESSGKSIYLAQNIINFAAGMTLANRGIKPCSSNTRTQAITIFTGPSVICELAFISNPVEEQMLGSGEWQEQMSSAIAQAVLSTFPATVYKHSAIFVPNSSEALIDGRSVQLPLPVQIVSNFTLVPLRSLIEGVGGTVTPVAGPGGETIRVEATWD